MEKNKKKIVPIIVFVILIAAISAEIYFKYVRVPEENTGETQAQEVINREESPVEESNTQTEDLDLPECTDNFDFSGYEYGKLVNEDVNINGSSLHEQQPSMNVDKLYYPATEISEKEPELLNGNIYNYSGDMNTLMDYIETMANKDKATTYITIIQEPTQELAREENTSTEELNHRNILSWNCTYSPEHEKACRLYINKTKYDASKGE